VVLLDFWATWCGPCRESIPHLVQLQKTYQERGFLIIGLSVDKGDGSAVRKFVKSADISYPVAMAPEEVARSYGVSSLPTTLFIDKQGRIRDKIVGFSSGIASQMATKIEELLSEQP
jgi:thiol-disulfide isomerase/thioredoxin